MSIGLHRTPVPWAEILEPSLKKHSFVKLPRGVARCGLLTAHARLLYALLVNYAWQDQKCFPGQERLANELGCCERALRDYTAELVKVGLIQIRRRGLGKTNLYVFMKLERFAGWLENQSRPAEFAGQDRQTLPVRPAKSAGPDPALFAGPIDEEDAEDKDAAAREAAADPQLAKEGQALEALVALNIPRPIAQVFANEDPDRVLAMVPFLRNRLADRDRKPIKNRVAFVRAVLTDPACVGSECLADGTWKQPSDYQPRQDREARAAKVDAEVAQRRREREEYEAYQRQRKEAKCTATMK